MPNNSYYFAERKTDMIRMNTQTLNYLLIIALTILVACAGQEAAPAASETTSAETATVTTGGKETMRAENLEPASSVSRPTPEIDLPTATPLPTATNTPLPTPTITPTPTPIPNLYVSGAHIIVGDWSPDSQWLAYWLSTEADLAGLEPYAWPGGMLHLLDSRSGESCPLPQFHTATWGQMSVTWESDGSLIVQDWENNEQWRGQPCQPDSSVRLAEPPMPADEPVEDRYLSPDGRLRITLELQEEEEEHWRVMLTTLRQVGGEEITAVTWRTRAAFAEDDPGGEWLSPTQFFIRLADGGPLLLDANRPGQAINVQTDLFGLARPAEDRGVAAAPGPSPDSFYLLLLSNRFYTAPIQLYHANSNLVESLPYYRSAPFSRDHQWLLMYGEEGNNLWIRRVNDVGGEWRLLGEGIYTYRWNAENTEITLGHDWQAVTWQAFPSGDLIGQWSTAPFFPYHLVGWSPDGRFLIALGSVDDAPWRRPQALFLFARDQR
jgi:hypothetical protein